MSGRERVAVEGLAQFRKGLRALDRDLPKALRVAQNDAASFLIGKAKPLIPRRSGTAAASLKARSSQTSVRVAIGGRKAPYMPWLDFGGRVGPNDSVTRPFLKEGRYLYPTLKSNREQFADILEDALTDVARTAGLDVD